MEGQLGHKGGGTSTEVAEFYRGGGSNEEEQYECWVIVGLGTMMIRVHFVT